MIVFQQIAQETGTLEIVHTEDLSLLTARSVDMSAQGINRTDGDFALAWIRSYGQSRVFYSAFGHFPESFTMAPIRTMLKQALLWITGQIDADTVPRSGPSAPPPAIAAGGVRDLAGITDAFGPGSIVTITGERLTSGSTVDAQTAPLPVRLAGTHVEVITFPAGAMRQSPDCVGNCGRSA